MFLILTRYHLWLDDWRGYIIAFFSLVFVANVYMSGFGELRLEIRQDRQEIATNDEIAEMRHRRQSAAGSLSAADAAIARQRIDDGHEGTRNRNILDSRLRAFVNFCLREKPSMK